jgi:hypothetical protein
MEKGGVPPRTPPCPDRINQTCAEKLNAPGYAPGSFRSRKCLNTAKATAANTTTLTIISVVPDSIESPRDAATVTVST